MSPRIQGSLTLSALCLLTACSSLEVRSPPCEAPPIPAALLVPCPDPELPVEGTFSALYLNSLKNTGPWGECMRRQDKLVELVKYQATVCPHIQSLNKTADKSSWQFWR